MKTILYYRKTNYGVMREYIHPSNALELHLIAYLTQQKTIDSEIRAAISKLAQIEFIETIAP